MYCDILRSLLKWRRVYYIYGPVQRYLLDLEGLDAPYSTHRPHGSISSSARPLVSAASSSSVISDGLPFLRRAVAACCSWLAGRRRQRPARQQQQQHEGVILPPRLQQAERSKSGDSLRGGRMRQPTAMSPAGLAGEQRPEEEEDDVTALQLVCRHRHLRLIMLPAVRDYVRDKWRHWGRGVLGRRMAVGYTTYTTNTSIAIAPLVAAWQ